MNTLDLNRPLFQLTVGEYLELQNIVISNTKVEDFTAKQDTNYVYGLAGIATLFGCSKREASNIKQKGIIDDAIMQRGRKIVVDANLAMQLWADSKKNVKSLKR